MKGTPEAPRCGFSRKIVDLLKANDIPFASFDILGDEEVRQGLKVLSDWPTYPQYYVKGELVGGLDIVTEMAAQGSLKSQLGLDSIQFLQPPEPLEERLRKLTSQAPVVIFIKGTPDMPRCGFTKSLLSILAEEQVEYASFDILTDEEVRQGLKTFSDWPTYPQVYANGNFIGGLDIIKEMRVNGPLGNQLK
jgi:Grx4 family monothiol glutaredoxin